MILLDEAPDVPLVGQRGDHVLAEGRLHGLAANGLRTLPAPQSPPPPPLLTALVVSEADVAVVCVAWVTFLAARHSTLSLPARGA